MRLSLFQRFSAYFSFRLSRIQISRPFLAFSLGTLLWANHHIFYPRPLSLKFFSDNRDIIFLSKQDYFDIILGNENSYFFLVVHSDTEDSRNVAQVAKRLKSLAEESGYDDWNVYVVNRSLFRDIKKTIGRTGNLNLFETTTDVMPVELYMKTPHSRDFLYIKLKANKFFTSEGLKKISRSMKKVHNLVQHVQNEEELKMRLGESLNKFGRPTIVMRVEDTNKVAYKKVIKKYSKLSLLCLERKFLPFDTNFILIKGNNLPGFPALEPNCPYIFRNDAVQAYERYSNKQFEDDKPGIVVDNIGRLGQKIFLEKYEDKQKVFHKIKNKEQVEERRKTKEREIESFTNFVLPRIVILRDLKYRELGQLVKKCAQGKHKKESSADTQKIETYEEYRERRPELNNEDEAQIQQDYERYIMYREYEGLYGKFVLSLYCPSNDPARDNKLAIFMDLYRKYKSMFVFCIMESDLPQDFFPHGRHTYPCLTLFNFLNQKKDYKYFGHYYKTLIYPFEKYYLNPKSPHDPNLQEVNASLNTVLERKTKVHYLNTFDENVQELRGSMATEIYEELRRKTQDGLIEFYDEGLESKKVSTVVDRLSEEFPSIKFLRMNSSHESIMFPMMERFPKLVYISHKRRKIIVIDQEIAKNENKLRDLIKEVKYNI